MEFQEYIKLKSMMAQRRFDGVCGIHCEDCPLSTMNNKYDMGCGDLEDLNPEVAEAIVKKWAEEHREEI